MSVTNILRLRQLATSKFIRQLNTASISALNLWEKEETKVADTTLLPDKEGIFIAIPNAVNEKNILQMARKHIQSELNRRINISTYLEPEKSSNFEMNFDNFGVYVQLDDSRPTVHIHIDNMNISTVPENGTILLVRNGSIALNSRTGSRNSIFEFR